MRFTEAGDIAVTLFDYATGQPVNLVTRRGIVAEGSPKVLGLPSCPTSGSLVERVHAIDEGRDVAVLTEGVMDTLAAVIAFPTCVAIGAHGAARLEDLATAATPRITAVRGWLLAVPHLDEVGTERMAKAAHAAIDGGLALDESLHLVDLGQHKDLADGLRAGWSYSWPN